MILELKRYEPGDEGTSGVIYTKGFACYTLEKPWHDNKPFISCIPPGMYRIEPYNSDKFHDVYELIDVSDRWKILIHTGNVAGDESLGLKSDSNGCILIGFGKGVYRSQKAVLKSTQAMNDLRGIIKSLAPDNLTIVIENLF